MCWSHDMCQSAYCEDDVVQLDAQGRKFGSCSQPAGVVLLPSGGARKRHILQARTRFDTWA